MIPNEQAIRALFSEAEENERILDRLLTNPDVMFAHIGVAIPKDSVGEFREFLVSANNDQKLATLSNWPSARCTVCTVSTWSIAAGIVAVGVAGLAALTVTSLIVIALAGWAGVTPAIAIAFIASLSAAIGNGVTKVAEKICEWAGICP